MMQYGKPRTEGIFVEFYLTHVHCNFDHHALRHEDSVQRFVTSNHVLMTLKIRFTFCFYGCVAFTNFPAVTGQQFCLVCNRS
uniref:Uncharacterized protein n=1 Tax=Setaria digitata TaxID=48799 RepID=A0A915PKA8_9BILA